MIEVLGAFVVNLLSFLLDKSCFSFYFLMC